MNDEIEFGEVNHEEPRASVRPDLDKHFGVVAVGDPQELELPIFVDMDVMREMESHAQEDPTTELGGVLLGGTHHDEQGKAYVVVRESLRAKFVESSKGSIKFTHDTWSAITEERKDFSDDLAMVGWYHTHPDWGVFLSGMDMFICDNFFNKPFDVALVIDPCRRDRGWFQWTGDPRERIRRTRGFYLTASRFRQHELEEFVEELEGRISMPAVSRPSSNVAYPAPVVNVTSDRSTGLTFAILGMLTLQFCFLALLGWRILLPTSDSSNNELAKAIKSLEESRSSAIRQEAQTELLDRVLTELKGAPSDTFQTMTELNEHNEQLQGALRGQLARERELKLEASQKGDTVEKLQNTLEIAQRDNKEKQDRLQSRLDSQTDELARLRKKQGQSDGTDSEQTSSRWSWSTMAWGVLIGATLATVGFAWWRSREIEAAEIKESRAAANN